MTINHPAALDAALMIETYLTDMRREYLPNDIFDHLSSEYINPTAEEPPALPNEIYLKLSAEIDKGRTCKVPMVKDLSAAPTLGSNGDQRLNEEDITTKWFRMEYTDLSHATTNQEYGIYARDKAPYKVFEYRVEGLAKYFKQYFGKMRRQALLELQSENLEDAPHFNAAGFSPNWFIPNRSFAQQPQYTDNAADWTDRIVATLNAAGVGINACCSLNWLIKLEEWARDEQMITPLDFENGSDGYVVILPMPQISWLLHTVQAGNAGAVWTAAASMPAEVIAKYPNMVGQFRGLRIVADSRYPTLTLGGSASNVTYTSDSGVDYTLTAQYRGMGRADDGTSDPRDKTANARQVGFLLGKAALVEWMPEGFHWEWEYEQYDKYFGSGIFCSVGIKQPIFNVTDGDYTTVQQDGSIVLPFAAPPETYYYSSHDGL
jgi:hypothetical protein